MSGPSSSKSSGVSAGPSSSRGLPVGPSSSPSHDPAYLSLSSPGLGERAVPSSSSQGPNRRLFGDEVAVSTLEDTEGDPYVLTQGLNDPFLDEVDPAVRSRQSIPASESGEPSTGKTTQSKDGERQEEPALKYKYSLFPDCTTPGNKPKTPYRRSLSPHIPTDPSLAAYNAGSGSSRPPRSVTDTGSKTKAFFGALKKKTSRATLRSLSSQSQLSLTAPTDERTPTTPLVISHFSQQPFDPETTPSSGDKGKSPIDTAAPETSRRTLTPTFNIPTIEEEDASYAQASRSSSGSPSIGVRRRLRKLVVDLPMTAIPGRDGVPEMPQMPTSSINNSLPFRIGHDPPSPQTIVGTSISRTAVLPQAPIRLRPPPSAMEWRAPPSTLPPQGPSAPKTRTELFLERLSHPGRRKARGSLPFAADGSRVGWLPGRDGTDRAMGRSVTRGSAMPARIGDTVQLDTFPPRKDKGKGREEQAPTASTAPQEQGQDQGGEMEKTGSGRARFFQRLKKMTSRGADNPLRAASPDIDTSSSSSFGCVGHEARPSVFTVRRRIVKGFKIARVARRTVRGPTFSARPIFSFGILSFETRANNIALRVIKTEPAQEDPEQIKREKDTTAVARMLAANDELEKAKSKPKGLGSEEKKEKWWKVGSWGKKKKEKDPLARREMSPQLFERLTPGNDQEATAEFHKQAEEHMKERWGTGSGM